MNSTSAVLVRPPSRLLTWLAAILLATYPGTMIGQEPVARHTPDSIIVVAREVIAAARFGALITIDSSGQPRARVMDPFPPEADMTVWLATNPRSRKVGHLRADPRVTLYYFDPGSLSYVTLTGTARLVDDPAEKARRWKEGWEAFYPNRDASYLLIEVTPVRLEVVSPMRGLSGNPATWTPDGVILDGDH